MATYKVIQDIEAEDKLIGPLTLRQFIYAGVAALCGYLTFLVVTKGAAFLAAFFLPIMAASGFFAWPWGRDQPTEIWALAKIRYLVKPRKRIWDQSGTKEMVTITAPKRVVVNYSNGLSQTEVHSRLRALAETIDSRGWAIKNVNVNMYGQPALIMGEPDSDRLINASALPREVPSIDVQASDDILDEHNNPVAHQFDTMIAASTKAHRQQILDRLHQSTTSQPATAATTSQQPLTGQQTTAPANDYWFLQQPTPAANSPAQAQPVTVPNDMVTFNTQVVAPGATQQAVPATAPMAATPTQDDQALVQQLDAQDQAKQASYAHLHTIQPLSAQRRAPHAMPRQPGPQLPAQKTPGRQVTRPVDAGILELSRNNDFNVATLAREAHKQRPDSPDDEVVISLH
jgi:hypothetical protein